MAFTSGMLFVHSSKCFNNSSSTNSFMIRFTMQIILHLPPQGCFSSTHPSVPITHRPWIQSWSDLLFFRLFFNYPHWIWQTKLVYSYISLYNQTNIQIGLDSDYILTCKIFL
jgi:hypothetical protein